MLSGAEIVFKAELQGWSQHIASLGYVVIDVVMLIFNSVLLMFQTEH